MTPSAPIVSFLVSVDSEPTDLTRLLASLAEQSDDRWELVVYGRASDGSSWQSVDAARDCSIRLFETRGSSTAQLRGALSMATGELVCLLHATSTLGTDVVVLAGRALVDHPDADVLYGEEARVDSDGELVEVIGRPAWSPERLRGQNFLAHLVLIRRQLLQGVLGTVDHPTETVAGHDLVLTVTERARRVLHLPDVLVAWSTPDPADAVRGWDASVRAVQKQVDRLGLAGLAARGPVPGAVRVVQNPSQRPGVSVVIPTDGAAGLVRGERRRYVVELVRSLVSQGGPPLEVVVVHTPSCSREVLAELHEVAGDRLSLVSFEGPFDLPVMLNRGAVAANGEVLVLFNDVTDVASPDFLSQLVEPLSHEGVGLAGPLAKAANETLVGTGLAVFATGVTPMYRGVSQDRATDALAVTREVSALDTTCLAIDRRTFELVGGVSETLPTLWSVDLSFKVAGLDLSRLWVEPAQLYDFTERREPVWPDPEDFRRLFLRWFAPDVDAYEPGYGRHPVNRRRGHHRLRR